MAGAAKYARGHDAWRRGVHAERDAAARPRRRHRFSFRCGREGDAGMRGPDERMARAEGLGDDDQQRDCAAQRRACGFSRAPGEALARSQSKCAIRLHGVRQSGAEEESAAASDRLLQADGGQVGHRYHVR